MSDCDGRGGEVVLSAACPGGMARQYRVQVRDETAPPHWRLVGCFRESGAAEAAVAQLAANGAAVRVVQCWSLPTAT